MSSLADTRANVDIATEARADRFAGAVQVGIGRMRVAGACAALLLVSLALVPVQLLAMRGGGAMKHRLPRLWHRAAAVVLGMRVRVEGAPATDRPLLLVSNHQSWADIVALGGIAELSFIAKAEVRGWPVFGWLARLHRTVFVERELRARTGAQADAIAERLAGGEAMVLFAEGTTSDGNGVLPFKSALFGAATGALARSGRPEMRVQPVAIAFTRTHGLPLGRAFRPLAAWPGDVPLAPHLARFLREGAIDVEISFGTPIAFRAGDDRKRLARRCEDEIAGLLAAALRGRADAAA